MITARWRIMLVVLRDPPSAARLPRCDVFGTPPREAATLAAQFVHEGAEVRLLDQEAEQMTDRTMRREVKLWRADLVVLWAGGSMLADAPIPDAEPIASFLAGWESPCPIVLMGPLARHHGHELLERHAELVGALPGGPTKDLSRRWEPGDAPGAVVRDGDAIRRVPGVAPDFDHDVLPAWHVLKLEAYDGDAPGHRRRLEIFVGGSVRGALKQAGHAVRRGGARFLVFADRDFGADLEVLEGVSRGLMGEVPGVPWACRIRADRITPAVALQLLRGGCAEVLIASPSDGASPGLAPMDDPLRSRIEAAVEAVRTTGMSPIVEHVVGRPGHTRDILAAWQRWFSDRRMVVSPTVRIVRPCDVEGDGPGLDEALERAGRWENELDPKDLQRAIRSVTARGAAGVLA